MGIEINENVLLTIAGVIFVPIFVFLIKMIMEVANIRTKLDSFQAHIDATKDFIKHFTNVDYEIRWLKERLNDIEDDLKYLFSDHHVGKGIGDSNNTFGSRRRFKGGRNHNEEDTAGTEGEK